MKNKISAVPYAVIAPLGVLLTAACVALLLMLPGMLFAQYFGVMFVAAFAILGRMPLHAIIVCVISLPLLLCGILCTVLRHKKKVQWILFAVCAVVYVVLFCIGLVVDTFSPQVARWFSAAPEMIEYYVQMDRQGMIGQGIAAFVIFLFSHLCFIPRIRTAAKLVPFVIFFILTLVLTPVYMLLFAYVLMMPMQMMLSGALATLTAAVPAGLVLLLMGLFMRIKPEAAPAAAPVAAAPAEPAPVAVPAPAPVVEEMPAPPEDTAVPNEPGMIFSAQKVERPANGAWKDTVWKIYRNGAVAVLTHTPAGEQSAALQLTPDGGRKAAELLQSFTFCDAGAVAENEARWDMRGYTAQGDEAHQVAGSVAGVPGLEAIAAFLEHELENYIVKTEENGGSDHGE